MFICSYFYFYYVFLFLPARTTFFDVKGSTEVKEELSDIVEYLRNPEKFEQFGARPSKGVLLVGPPGCGKTLIARALAGEAGVPFFYASGSEFEEMFVGLGAKRIRTLFSKCSVLLHYYYTGM